MKKEKEKKLCINTHSPTYIVSNNINLFLNICLFLCKSLVRIRIGSKRKVSKKVIIKKASKVHRFLEILIL